MDKVFQTFFRTGQEFKSIQRTRFLSNRTFWPPCILYKALIFSLFYEYVICIFFVFFFFSKTRCILPRILNSAFVSVCDMYVHVFPNIESAHSKVYTWKVHNRHKSWIRFQADSSWKRTKRLDMVPGFEQDEYHDVEQSYREVFGQ